LCARVLEELAKTEKERDRVDERRRDGEWVCRVGIRFACKYKWVSSVQCGGGGEVVKYCPRTTIFFRLRVSNGCRFSFDICTGEGGGHTAVVAINYPLLSIRRDKGTLRYLYIYNNNVLVDFTYPLRTIGEAVVSWMPIDYFLLSTYILLLLQYDLMWYFNFRTRRRAFRNIV